MDKLTSLINSLGGATPTILIGALVASMALLLLKNKIGIPEKYIWKIWVCLIFSASMLVAIGIVKGYEYNLNKSHEKKLYSRLEFLTPKEKEFLNVFIEKNTRTRFVGGRNWVDVRTASVLENDGIIYRAETFNESKSGCVFNINNKHFIFLQKNPELLKENPT